ncbi:hypothetical protein [Streptomyces sp. NPDC017673]|uniref:hypothetical protein n=1 Tax=unclassified Streptomyces TaxID=2593676 RepID=UPI00378F0481
MSSRKPTTGATRRSYGSSQYDDGSSAGHSSAPATELPCTVGAPGHGCGLVAVRAGEAG